MAISGADIVTIVNVFKKFLFYCVPLKSILKYLFSFEIFFHFFKFYIKLRDIFSPQKRPKAALKGEIYLWMGDLYKDCVAFSVFADSLCLLCF